MCSFLFSLPSQFIHSCAHFIYPSLCLHCHTLLAPHSGLLCSNCADDLQPIDPEHRCVYCFDELEESRKVCEQCRTQSSLFHRKASVFEYEGVAASLVRKFKYGGAPYLSKGIGSFMLAQWDRLEWPLPDIITYVPLSMLRFMERGYNQSELLAQELGKMLHRPVMSTLKRRSGGFSQAQLPLAMRKQSSFLSFEKKKKVSIAKKTVLLVDDVMTSGSTLKRCAEALIESESAILYALTFCKA